VIPLTVALTNTAD
jgi:hypothetical protein